MMDSINSKENSSARAARIFSGEGHPRSKLEAANWLEGISDSDDFDLVEVAFKNTRNGYYTNPQRLHLKIGDIVTVEGAPGHDVGRVNMVGRLVRLQMKKEGVKKEGEFKKIYRLATEQDMEKYSEARAREHSTMIRARKIAEELSLNMKIGDVEYQGDGGKAIFYYIADERVDFRKLIRVLADTFKVRVEMKQIGARQEAGRIGGIGPCGRPLCCSSWMTHFISVGTGAARMQDLSMNPQKLAGQCAKLKCCLNFEIDAYGEAQKQIPHKDQHLETKDATYYLFKTDILARKVTYSTDKKLAANLVTIDARRAFEIIALNKQGIKVDSLESDEATKAAKGDQVKDLVEQESLTRFDKSKKKKKRKPAPDRQPQKREKPESAEGAAPDRQPQKREKPEPAEGAAPGGEERKNAPKKPRKRRPPKEDAQ